MRIPPSYKGGIVFPVYGRELRFSLIRRGSLLSSCIRVGAEIHPLKGGDHFSLKRQGAGTLSYKGGS